MHVRRSECQATVPRMGAAWGTTVGCPVILYFYMAAKEICIHLRPSLQEEERKSGRKKGRYFVSGRTRRPRLVSVAVRRVYQ